MGNRPADKAAADGGHSLVDRVHAAMREAILSGAYAPRSRLLVARISAENGVSPIPVREAIRRLEAERLVVVARNRGATVAPVSLEDMRDVFATRTVIECNTLQAAHAELDEEALATAERELGRMTARLRVGDDQAAYVHHRAFHFALYEPAGSSWSMHLIDQLWSGAERYQRLAARLRERPEEFAAAEHAELLAVVRDGDADEAEKRLREHLTRSAGALERAYTAAA